MRHTLTFALLGGLAIGAAAHAQDQSGKKDEGPKVKTVEKKVIVEADGDGNKTGVVILSEDGGPPNVMFLEGEELDDLDLDFHLDHGPGAPHGAARMKLSFGGEGGTFDFTFDGPPDPERLKQIQERVRAHLKKAGIDRDIQLPMFDPKKRAAWAKQAKERAAKMRTAMRARQRDRLLKELKVEGEEKDVLGPLLEKVLDEHAKLKQQKRKARRALYASSKKTEDLKAAKKLVQEFRTQQTEAKSPLQKAREELRALLTVRQEALLVGRGLLD